MKGYKAFYPYKDGLLRCRDKLYEVGGTYTESEAIMCYSGMHFCTRLINCFLFYSAPHAIICEIEAPEWCITKRDRNLDALLIFEDEFRSKMCTTKLTVIRQLSIDEVINICSEELKTLQNLPMDVFIFDNNVVNLKGTANQKAAYMHGIERAYKQLVDEHAYQKTKICFEEMIDRKVAYGLKEDQNESI